MPDYNWRKLEVSLLQGGVSPKYVGRTLQELRHHFAELKSEALDKGLSAEQAEAEAATRLGDEPTIVKEVLARPELKSWPQRMPLITFGLLPLVIFTLAYVVVVLLVFQYHFRLLAYAFEYRSSHGLQEIPIWLRFACEGGLFFASWMLAPLFAIGMAVYAKRNYIPLFWCLLCALVLGFAGGGWFYTIDWQHGYTLRGWAYFFIDSPQPPQHMIYGIIHMLATVTGGFFAYHFTRRVWDTPGGKSANLRVMAGE